MHTVHRNVIGDSFVVYAVWKRHKEKSEQKLLNEIRFFYAVRELWLLAHYTCLLLSSAEVRCPFLDKHEAASCPLEGRAGLQEDWTEAEEASPSRPSRRLATESQDNKLRFIEWWGTKNKNKIKPLGEPPEADEERLQSLDGGQGVEWRHQEFHKGSLLSRSSK